MKSIAVLGGNGFLGSKICEIGVRRGWAVTSLSRSGLPPKQIKDYDNSWMDKVSWEKGDLFDPKSYKEKLVGKNAVVHSVGILFEDTSYKKTVKQQLSLQTGAQALLKMLKGPNPMLRLPHSSYSAIQRDSALLLADTYSEVAKNVENPTFAYISADQKPPFLVPDGYITSKREAEYELSCRPALRSIFMRPGFMYNAQDPLNPLTLIGKGIDKQYQLVGMTGIFSIFDKDNSPFFKTIYRPSVSTEEVASKLYEKLEQPNFKGVVTLSEIRNGK